MHPTFKQYYKSYFYGLFWPHQAFQMVQVLFSMGSNGIDINTRGDHHVRQSNMDSHLGIMTSVELYPHQYHGTV